MSVTATRLGSAPITIDWSNFASIPASASRTSSGTADSVALKEAWDKLKKQFENGEVGFYNVPSNNNLSQAEESLKLANEILQQSPRITDCLFLGIGGSALGPISLLSALRDRCSDKIRFHVMENPDPTEWRMTLCNLKPENTLVCAVTESGTTFETVAQFLIALDWLGESRWRSNTVVITDPDKGDMRKFAEQKGLRTLFIAPSMGGRFSIFTPVGLFPAALAGLSVKDFLQGAQQVRDYTERTAIEKNPLFTLGYDLIRHFNKRPMHVCMPYSTQLRQLGCWFVQLWAESLGKDGKGFTPLSALGATDQHSILQLLRDGPDDKVTFFMTVDQGGDPVAIPNSLPGVDFKNYPAFALLKGHSLGHLLNVEYRAISLVLTKRSRPHLTFRLDRLDERTMGALYFAFSVLTAVTGTLWGVNPFDQPGVEEGKVYIRESLSKDASDSRRASEEDENSPVNRLRRHRQEETGRSE